MLRLKKMKWVGVGLLGTLALSACSRSTAYKKDQEYVTQPNPYSYYNRPPKSQVGTEQVEKMGQPKKRVMVLDFWNDTPVKSDDLGKMAADELRRSLHLSGRIIIPKEVTVTSKTQDFVQGDQVRVGQLIREARNLGVSLIVIGRITKAIFRSRGDDIGLFRQRQALAAIDVEVKMFDVQSGREVLASGKSGEATATAMAAFEKDDLEGREKRLEMLQIALKQAVLLTGPDVLKATEKMIWEGAIAKVVSGKCYINAGKSSGLVPGDILKVITQGDEIYDPSTGAFLGRTQGQLKGTLEVIDFLDGDGAIAEVHTGGNFAEGDLVQLY